MIAERGFTEQQWRVLRVVTECEPIDVSTLSDYTALHMPSVTRILQTLEAKDLISRVRDSSDSRRLWISTTPAAKLIMAGAGAGSQAIMDNIRANMGDEKLELLVELLSELAEIKPQV